MRLVCLAKSWKHGGRCVAGVQVEPTDENRYRVVRDGEEPRWIRPVTHQEHGAVPESVVRNVCLLDIIELPDAEPCPSGYQSENVLYDHTAPPSVIRKLPKSGRILENFVTRRGGPLFGNQGKAVHQDRIRDLDYSLLLIQPSRISFADQESSSGKPQLRAHIIHETVEYDLPVTDPEFVEAFRKGGVPGEPANTYITISLGLPFNEFHFKLVAGVFVLDP